MKRVFAVVLTVLAMIAFVFAAAGCEPMIEDYSSDTFELGESSMTK